MQATRTTASPLRFVARAALAASIALAGSAFAGGPVNAEYYPFPDLVQMKAMDKNKDGMVSKKEFLDMMSQAWDMNAARMGVKGAMTPDQFKEILMYLKAGA